MFNLMPLSNSCASSAVFQAALRFNSCAKFGECLVYHLSGLRLHAMCVACGRHFFLRLHAQLGFAPHSGVRSSSVQPNIWLKADGFAAA
jgi:hypothetical protein